MENKHIGSVRKIDSWLNIIYTDGTEIIVPEMIGGVAIPLVDPYNPSIDNGCMVGNRITYSALSTYAKQAYTVMRSHCYYGTGFTFVTMEKIAEGMSCTRQKAKDALEELKYFGVIRIERKKYRGFIKDYFALCPSEQWHLPKQKNQWKKIKQSKDLDFDEPYIDELV